MKKELQVQNITLLISKKTKQFSKFSILLIVLTMMFTAQIFAQGTWTPLANVAPDPNNGVMLLMTDGTILCHTTAGGPLGDGTIFDRLTPDSTGSYINGTWSQIAPMARERYSFSSAVLKDGRVYAAGGEYGTDGTQNGSHGEVYDITTNTWIQAIGPGAVMSDGNCKLLDNGKILQALVDVPMPVSTVIYDPATNAYVTGPPTINGQNESMWLKLPDNSVLFVDEGLQTSERYIPALNQWIVDSSVPVALYDAFGFESGPGFMLPDGRAFFMGATGHTAYYTPSGTNSPGAWIAGPDIPSGRGMPDAPGAMMVNGKIIFACSAAPTSAVEFAMPAYFYEFDYLTNTYTQINAPAGGLSVNAWSQQCDLLDLPDGTVLFGLNQDATSAQYYIYTPVGAPLAAGKPVINNITSLSCTTYKITGHGFNGISEGSEFGDENENDSNYPLIRLTAAGKVYYARSYNWNSTGVQRGLAPDTAYFSLSAPIPNGVYSLVVVANGIASDPVSFTDSVPSLSSSLNPPAVCSGAAFTYVPTTSTTGATFTWTRAGVAGISNAAITTPQSSNPNEVLTNTTSLPVTVVYAYSVTGHGCNDTMNVSVVVNPPPVPAFTAFPISSCSLPDSVSFSNNSIAGSTYTWSFGDGITSTATAPSHIYTTAGTYSVKLIATSVCGTDSLTYANLVVVNPPSTPVAASPITISCGGIATLTATGTDTLKWFGLPTGGSVLGTGTTYVTPPLSSNTNYYVESYISSAPSFCPPLINTFGTGSNYTSTNFRSDIFSVHLPCALVSVMVVSGAAGNRTIQLQDSVGTVLQSRIVNIPTGTSTVVLNFPLTVGTGYQLGCGDGSTTTNLYRNSTGAAFPYTDPSNYITITGNNVPDALHFYFFYDWKLEGLACISARTPVDVIISGGPLASYTSVTSSNTVTFTNTSTGSTSWLWNFGDGGTSTVLNPVHTYTSVGTYTVTLTSYSGGCYNTITETVVITTLGINSNDLTNVISIFPNPTTGLFTISASFNTNEEVQLIVTNTIGQIIYETMPVTIKSQQFNLDLENKPKGIYFIRLKTNNGNIVKKLILN